jgi:DMSO/TMAO reductase YedYZ molybdopterin-dependent catalytic subunit
MLKRRSVLQALGGAALGGPGMVAGLARAAEKVPLTTGLPAGEYDTAVLDALPGKKPLIKLAYRPPNYETPVSYFASDFTPNDAFFVRYHLADIPDKIDPATWRVKVGGEAVSTPLELSLSDLQSGFAPVELAAVCQCSGNRRGLSDPHVPGVQWGLGAMGNALWKGVRLKDVLAKAGLKKEAVELVFNGADGPVVDKTPDFVKSLPVWKALDENTLIAYQMNGQALPHLNGAPARIVVPGWTATYWMKHLVSIDAVTKPFEGFWMKSAYRIPTGKFPVIDRFLTQELPGSTPITEMVVNSLIVTPGGPVKEKLGKPVELRGVAWDGGYGITRVEISSDGGTSWLDAVLGKDLGRFAFRPWSYRFAAKKKGNYAILARASNKAGQTQADSLIFNPAGYHNNVPRPLSVTIA